MTCHVPRRVSDSTTSTSPFGSTRRRLLPATAVALALTGLSAGLAVAGPASPSALTSGLVATTVSGANVADGAGDKDVPRAGLPTTTGEDTQETTGAPDAAGPTAVPLRTVPVATTAEFQAAIVGARAGDRIVLAAGTYTGPFEMKASGTADNPIVVTSAPGAAVTLMTPGLKYPACNATGPDVLRTVSISQGASHWVLTGLTVDGGLRITSKDADATQKWQADKVNKGDWGARRGIPGADTRDPAAASTAIAYLGSVTHSSPVPSDDIQLIGNTFVGKGIFGRLTRYGVFSDNVVTNIACGTGPGVWMTNFSSGWVVSGNDVSQIAHSTAIHYMQEGIRFGNGSDYNVISDNYVHDLTETSRAITTDQDSSWNLITGNTVSNADIAFNEQMSSWGNIWRDNHADNIHKAAFSFRMEDIRLTTPSKATSSFYTEVSCNTATNSLVDFQVGAVAGGTFTDNSFATVKVGKELQGYWAQQGNLWNGQPVPPVKNPAPPTGTC